MDSDKYLDAVYRDLWLSGVSWVDVLEAALLPHELDLPFRVHFS